MKHTDKGHLGELLGMAWLMKKGYWVFKNQAHQGPIDCVAVDKKTGEILLLDFKCVSRYKTGGLRSRTVSTQARKLGVRLLYVDVEKMECRIVKRRKDLNMKRNINGRQWAKTEIFTKISNN